MRLRLKTGLRKKYERIQKQGHWHRKLIIFPRVLKNEKGINEFIFLERVNRKAEWRVNLTQYGNRLAVHKWIYNTDGNIVYTTLAEGDELMFYNDDAKQEYEYLKGKLDEE
jgi:hypothetical protein